jgi:nucleoside-diphosphate-sugar epimerase
MFFIFGSSGFIGKKLKEKLVKQFGNNLINYVGKKYKDKIVDLSEYNVFKELPTFQYENVYILAAKSDFIFNNKKEEKSQIQKNTSIVKNIIKFCRKCKVKRVFFISSSSVYSNKNLLPFHENQKIKPDNSLGRSKYSSEKILKKAFIKLNTKVVILRVFTVYGHNMRKKQFLYQAIKKFKSSKKILTFWNKETLRNFIHIDDLINIIINLSKIETPKYTIYNIASNNSYKIEKIINYLQDISGKQKKIIFKYSKNNLNHIVNINKIKKKINTDFKDLKKELIKIYETF